MNLLKKEGCTVISMEGLLKYVDPKKGPKDPYQPIKERVKDES